MNYPNFHDITYFKPEDTIDNWGDASKISRDLLLKLDRLRHHLGIPVYITSGFRKGSGSSQHHYGNAVDIVVPTFQGTLLDLYLYAERFDFGGLGLYRDWEFRGSKSGGLHLDIREEPKGSRWMCVKDEDGVQRYFSITEDNLKKFGVI